jgi:hypothetical protein
MAKSSKRRTQVKDLPKKEKKLGAGDMKKVKGGQTLNDPKLQADKASAQTTTKGFRAPGEWFAE